MPTYSWKTGVDPNQICQRLQQYSQRDEQGRVVYEGFQFLTDKVVLGEMFDFDEQIKGYDKENIITNAIFSVGKKGKITPAKLRNTINKLIREYHEIENKKYVFIASLSISSRFKLEKRVINGSTITFHTKIDKAFYNAYNQQLDQSRQIFQGDFPSNYIYTKLFVNAKSPNHANVIASNSLGLLRGIWNLGLNKDQGYRITFKGPASPLNKITLGPIQTLHERNGKLATDSFWYQPEYQKPLPVYESTQQFPSLMRYEKNARKTVKNHNYRADIEEAIIRYVEALDLYNFHDSFIRLWGLLETLTSNRNDTQLETVKKTVFHFASSDKDYVRQLLYVLRKFRNNAVHMGSNTQHIERFMQMLKQCVEAILQFHITNKFKFNSLKEATEFFELTQTKEEYLNELALLKKNEKLLKNLKTYQGW